jgi:hypothetical protein
MFRVGFIGGTPIAFGVVFARWHFRELLPHPSVEPSDPLGRFHVSILGRYMEQALIGFAGPNVVRG